MSNEIDDIENLSDEELEKQALAEAEAKQTKAEPEEPEPEPETVENASQAAAPESNEPPVTPSPTPEPVSDRQQGNDKDPMEWAKRKGLPTDSPEAAMRAAMAGYEQLEKEFHKRAQAGHPGFQDLRNGNPAPSPVPPQNWNPQPVAPPPGYGYPPPPTPNLRQLAARYPQVDPEDFERIAPIMADIAKAAAFQERMRFESELSGIRRQTERSSEFSELMQDPAFSDPHVRAEMHEVLKDGSLFQRGGQVYKTALQIAVGNLYRKQLQQGMSRGNNAPSNNPPVTAGGGNGSANAGPYRVTEKDFLSWTEEQQKAFLASNGTKVPRR